MSITENPTGWRAQAEAEGVRIIERRAERALLEWVRAMVEGVRSKYPLPDHDAPVDHKLHDYAVRDGAHSALNALLTRLEKT